MVVAAISSMVLMFVAAVAGAETARARMDETPVRAEANLDAAVIATLKEGTAVDVIDVQGDYYRVLVPGDAGPTVGYVLARLVDLDDAGGSSNETTVPPASPAARPVAQGAPIPPTLVQLGFQHVKELERKHVAGAKTAARQLAAEQRAMDREIAAERKAMERELAAERKAMEREQAAEKRELEAEKKATERRLAAEREAAKRVEAAKAERDRLNAVVEALKAQPPAGARRDH
jgi:flagellar biosynthesis GTPase FlhF